MSPFTLSAPLDGWSPLLLASPHSGTHVPRHIASRLPLRPATLRRLEDAHVGRLFAPASAHAPLIEATHARAVIDLNRAETDFDRHCVEGGPAEARSERARAGFGLFPRLVAPGQAILSRPLKRAEAAERILALHRPWHGAIASGLDAARRTHGIAILVDCHSMPPLGPGGAEVVLGDRFGTSAAPPIIDLLEQAFRGEGLKVVRNQPYAGGHTLERHGRPEAGIHAIQIELCRALYMNPETLGLHAGFQPLSDLLARVIGLLSGAYLGGLAVAAE